MILRPPTLQFLTIIAVASAPLCGLTGCSVTSPIQPARSSKSAFDGTVYRGETITLYAGTAGNEAYRVFKQGAAGLVSLQSVLGDAEQRAKEFCERKGELMEPIRETTATHWYILGSAPRAEIVFECVDKPTPPMPSTADDSRYA